MNEMISVIIPIYNVEKELPKCLDSVVGQTYPYLEIILVNDGSTDASAFICEEYASGDSRIILIHKANGGLSAARNAGLMRAAGTYVMYVDSDDYIELTACEHLISGMLKEDVDFVVGSLKELHGDFVSYQRHSNIEPGKIYAAREFVIASIKANEWFAPAVLNLYRRSFLLKNDLLFKQGRYYEDMEMLPRMYLKAGRITYVDFDFYCYVIRKDSITTSLGNPRKARDAMSNYSDWKKSFDGLDDGKLQGYLYGMLIKCYLKSCRTHKVTKWLIPGLKLGFALKYALNGKERLKAVLFGIMPRIYVGMKQ